MSAGKLHITYDELHNHVVEYAKSLKNNVEVDCVVAVARGGLLVGQLIAYELNLPIHVVNFSSLTGQGTSKQQHIPMLPDRYDSIMLVDDICDSGHTLKELVNVYERLYDVFTYTVFYRDIEQPVHIPDYSIKLIGPEWIVFPWDNR